MSGHSKWSSIKHQKGVTDAKRGQLEGPEAALQRMATFLGGLREKDVHRLPGQEPVEPHSHHHRLP